jgi:hypothetical protein
MGGALVTPSFPGGRAETVSSETDPFGFLAIGTTGTEKGGPSPRSCVEDVAAPGLV